MNIRWIRLERKIPTNGKIMFNQLFFRNCLQFTYLPHLYFYTEVSMFIAYNLYKLARRLLLVTFSVINIHQIINIHSNITLLMINQVHFVFLNCSNDSSPMSFSKQREKTAPVGAVSSGYNLIAIGLHSLMS